MPRTPAFTKIPSDLAGEKVDELAKSLKTVMLDLIQHPEAFEITGFLLSQE